MIGESMNYYFRYKFLSIIFILDLKSAFDERSIFPKYILDYEAKQRQLFESPNQQQQTTTAAPQPAATTTGGLNPNTQSYTRQTTEALMKLKRKSSSSTLLSDQRIQ